MLDVLCYFLYQCDSSVNVNKSKPSIMAKYDKLEFKILNAGVWVLYPSSVQECHMLDF